MKSQVLNRELFQLTEKIHQTEYKINVQQNPAAKQMLEKKRESLVTTRNQVKMLLRVLYDNTSKTTQCVVY